MWFMLNTCPVEFISLLLELYEKFLVSQSSAERLVEFEQVEKDREVLPVVSKVSFYLMELIFYDVNLKLLNASSHIEGRELLSKYLHRPEIVSKLEPNDLCILWLCAIHLEAFSCLPNMVRCKLILNSRVLKHFEKKEFWRLGATKRSFNQLFFQQLDDIYLRIENNQKNSICRDQRQTDMFLLPWNSHYTCTIEKLQSLFYEALKSITSRLALIGTSSETKQLTRLVSVPLFINLLTLEMSNKRHEVAAKLCERLLKSSDAEILKELWISQIFIHRSQGLESSKGQIENTIKCSLKIFPMDAQITFVAAQYYASIVSGKILFL